MLIEAERNIARVSDQLNIQERQYVQKNLVCDL